MIVELLTPFLIATTPVTVDMPAQTAVYSHSTQTTVTADETVGQYSTKTLNGTRTYDWQGKPSDNDNDSD